MTRVIAFSLALTMAAAAPGAAAPASPEIAHHGQTTRDAFLLAVRGLLGKPVLWHPWQPDFEVLRIPRTRRELDRTLRASRFRLLEESGWAYLVRKEITFPYNDEMPVWMRIRARRFSLARSTFDVQSDRSYALTDAESARIADRVLRDARLVAIANTNADPSADDGQLSIELLLAKTPLARGKAGFVALVRANPEAEVGRVVFGEIEGDRTRVVWDSPFVPARSAEILLTDLDGDSKADIVLRARTGQRPARDLLVAFDRSGRELTRQSECEPFSNADIGAEEGQVCAIVGDEVVLDRRNGRVEILATSNGVASRYVQYRGRFVLSRPAS